MQPLHKLLPAWCLLLAASSHLAGEEPALSYRVQENVVYAEVHGIGLVMDVFTPVREMNGLAIVEIASGAWYSDRGKLDDLKRARVFEILCGRGYTVFAIRPGSISKFGVLEMVDHVERGVRWVKAHSRDFQIAPDNLGLMGASAGGHLACLLAVTKGSTAGPAVPLVAAVGVFFPPTDFLNYGGVKLDPRSAGRFGELIRSLAFRGGAAGLDEKQIYDRMTAISPARLVTEHAPPFLLIHGGLDFTVPLQQSRAMVAALQDKGVPNRLVVKPGGGHPWPTIHEEVAVMADWFDRQLAAGHAKHGRPRIAIDGQFDDWAGIRTYHDPADDTHDTDHKGRHDAPQGVCHPDVDLLEYKVAHDRQNLYFYFRTRGHIGRTEIASSGKRAGRYYVIVAIDVDQDDSTGYWLHEGGYYPTSHGYDVNAEIEYFDGQLNTACFLNHGAGNTSELRQAFADQSQGEYQPGNSGPYAAGFIRLLPGTYAHYTQWVYHQDGRITFVRDKGPVVSGAATAAISADGHQLEAAFPLTGFLKRQDGTPIIAAGSKLDLSFTLEASGELSRDGRWASDTGEPVNGYLLSPGR